MKTSGDILTKMGMTIFFQNEGKDMNIEENSVVELKKELIRHKRKKIISDTKTNSKFAVV